MSDRAEKLLALTAKECDAFRDEIEDLRRELWEWECREEARLGPPPGWKPDPLDVAVPPKEDR
jgi:hypothetical protein